MPFARRLAPALFCALLAAGCADNSQDPAEVTSFRPSGETLSNGEPATAAVRVKNTGTEERSLWLSFEVRDAEGERQTAPPRPVLLDTGEVSETQTITTGPLTAPGPYDAKVSVWDGRPGGGSKRLANAEREDAFELVSAVSAGQDDFESFDGGRWLTSDKRLGRSQLREANVEVGGGELRLRLPADTLEGGELASREVYTYGSFEARIRTADAPSSITGFFLYSAPDFHSEIDMEIYNDHSRRVLFTTYANGEQTNTVTKKLPFDPTAGFHNYRIALYPTGAEFYVDGRLFQTFQEGIPADSMQLMVNAWHPEWLTGTRPKADAYTRVDWIRL